MAYDQRDRDPRSRQDDPRRSGRDDRGERGFFERTRDEFLSWTGDEEAERRREMDERSSRGGRGDHDRDDGRRFYSGQQRSPSWRDDDQRRPYAGRAPERSDTPRRSDYDRDQGSYRPMTGDYGRASDELYERELSSSRRTAPPPASGATVAHDRHYSEWRQRQIDEIDRDYDEYRREHQAKFESDFSNWRSTRQQKRQMLGSIREHMQVFGADEQPVGTVDKVRGDRVILTKGDSPDARHHSIPCAMIGKVEGDRVVLDKPADEAKAMFGTEERDRALYERDDQREPGAHILNRSFSGTY